MTRFRTSHLALMAVLAAAAGLPVAAAAPAAAATTYTITDLGSLGGGVTHGLAINAFGQVTGDSVLSTLVQVPCPPQKYGQPKKCFTHPDDAFVWSNGTMTDLGTLGGNFSQGVAINGSGEVVGESATKNPGPDGAFLSNGHSMKPLSAPSFVYGINDSGQIVGQCRDSMLLQSYPCVVSSNGSITALPESNPNIECLYINTISPANIPAAVAINTNGCPAVSRGQQLRDQLHQFPADVEGGTIGDHVKPFRRRRSCGETSSTGAPRPLPASPVRPRVCPDAPVCLGRTKPGRPDLRPYDHPQ